MEGWISLHRKFLSWEWFDDSGMVKLFIFLMLTANHKDGYWKGISIKRGQLITGLNKLNSATGIPIQSLKTFLKRLEKTGEIRKQSTNKFTIITLCKYDDYQRDKIITNKQTTNHQQTTNKQLTTNNNVNKEIKERESKDSCQLSVDVGSKNKSPNEEKESGYFHEVCEVINYLNLKTGKKLRPESKSSKHIRGRLRDGFLVEDLKLVVDLKVDEWLHDVKMKKYLKPDTLFNAEKFDKYQDEIDDSTVGSAHNANLKKGDLITLEHLEKFEDDDVIICDFKTYDPDSFEDTTGARYKVKAIKGRISNKRGEFKFIEVVN